MITIKVGYILTCRCGNILNIETRSILVKDLSEHNDRPIRVFLIKPHDWLHLKNDLMTHTCIVL